MSNRKYWDKNLEAYRVKKRVRALLENKKIIELAKEIGYSKQYINNWRRDYLPSKDFITKLQELENENNNT